MQEISEEKIKVIAPNQNAVANGKKISEKGGFVKLERSADDTFYMGECKGSGKSNYITSVDFIEPETPLCRCTCPSRQFPCKHGIALLYEIAAHKEFGICDIPEDIIKKREKKLNREKKAESADVTDTTTKKKTTSKTSKSARTKKIKKQLEGLDMVSDMITNSIRAGVGVMGAGGVKSYEQFSKKLGDYYLPGLQHIVNEIIIELTAFNKDGKDKHFDIIIHKFEKLWSLVKKSKEYLNKKLESEDVYPDDTELYELLGGVWKLEELEQAGLSKKDVDLLQLSFNVVYDEAGKQYIDEGYYICMDSGEIVNTYNYRPVKAMKYIKENDSEFHITHIDSMAVYPGQSNHRVRWNGGTLRDCELKDIEMANSFANNSIYSEVKKVKNIIKNALASDYYYSLISFKEVVNIKDKYLLFGENKENVMLEVPEGMENTLNSLKFLENTDVVKDNIMFGAFFNDEAENRIKFYPMSIVTKSDIVRLLY